jgi:hypothetical protein
MTQGNRTNHPKKYKDGRKRWAEPRRKSYMKEYMKTYPKEKKRRQDRNYHKKLKEAIIILLGRKCIICGYSGIALQVDHVNNGGNEERKKFINGGNNRYGKFILDKIKAGSKDYQLLCANCNVEKELDRRAKD